MEKRNKPRRSTHVLLYSRNSSLQDDYQSIITKDFKGLSLHYTNDYTKAAEFFTDIDEENENPLIVEAVIVTDNDSLSYKLIDYINTNKTSCSVICINLVPYVDADNSDHLQRLQSYKGVNILMSSEQTIHQILSTLTRSLQKGNEIDALFKDLKETHYREKEYPYLPVFDKKFELPVTSATSPDKRSLNLQTAKTSSTLDMSAFSAKQKKNNRSTTVAGLDRGLTQRHWRDYISGSSRMSYYINGNVVPPDDISIRSSVVSNASDSNRDSIGETSEKNVDKLRVQQHAKQRISEYARSVPRNIQIDNIVELDLYTLKINLAERDLLQRGIRYQISGDFDRAKIVFTTAGLRSKPYVAKILMANLYYEQSDFINAIKEYGDAISSMQKFDDPRCLFVACFNRAIAYFCAGNDSKGLHYITKAVKLDKTNYTALEILTIAQRRLGQHSEAMCGLMTLSRYRKEKKVLSESVVRRRPSEESPMMMRRLSATAILKREESIGSSSSLGDSKITVATPVIRMPIQTSCHRTLKDMLTASSKSRSSTSTTDHVSSSTAGNTLESFKIMRGINKNLSQQLFDCPTQLQAALSTPPGQRSRSELATIIAEGLNLFPFLKRCSKSSMYEIAKVVRYHPTVESSNLYNQQEEIETICLLLSGKVTYSMESTLNGIQNITIGELGPHQAICAVDMLFCRDDGNLINIPKKQKELSKNISDYEEEDLRSFLPLTFLSYSITAPSELILLSKHEFDNYLVPEAAAELHRMLDVINASKVFKGWSLADKIRLARMGRINQIRAGVAILEQGERPKFLCIIVQGMCKVSKKPNDVDVLLRKLKEARFKAEQFDLKYAYHHKLRDVLSRAPEEELPQRLRGLSTRPTLPELGREQLRIEIQKLEAMLAKKHDQEGKEVSILDGYTEITDLYWPAIFGEACVLDNSETGVSLGKIVAETSCEIFMIHKTQLQTFQLEERLLEELKRKGIIYPHDEMLAKEEKARSEWVALQGALVHDIQTKRL